MDKQQSKAFLRMGRDGEGPEMVEEPESQQIRQAGWNSHCWFFIMRRCSHLLSSMSCPLLGTNVFSKKSKTGERQGEITAVICAQI